MQVLIGTSKGLMVYEILPDTVPKELAIHFLGFSVNMIFVDERSHRWWVGIAHRHWGQKVHYSDDQGASWEEAKLPSYQGFKMINGAPAKLKEIWSMQHGGADSERLWLGTEPGGLFSSTNGGATFELNEPLWDHTSRQKEGKWFGAGSDFPFIHSIEINPHNSSHLYVAISCAGIFESMDNGASWQPRNKGLLATYLPNPNVEVGQDPHQLLINPEAPNVLWQQNHCGIYFTKNGGKLWTEVFLKKGISSYGFSLAIDEKNPARSWVIPVESDQRRVAPDLKLEVFETTNFGQSWKSVSKGLPIIHSFDIVLRKSFKRKENLMIFGTTNGNLFYTLEETPYWQLISSHLTKVNTVCIV